MKKTSVKMNKAIIFRYVNIRYQQKRMHKFWYKYIKPKYGGRAKLCYTYTDSFVIPIITDYYFEVISTKS